MLASELVSVTVRPLPRPDPADNPASAEDRLQAAQEFRHYVQWPWELEIVIRVGEGETATDCLYGAEGQARLRELLALGGIL